MTKEEDINKVILFTKKEKPSPPFMAISALFRDRLRFIVVPVPEKDASPENAELMKQYEIEDLPTLVIEQTFDQKTNEVIEKNLVKYTETEYKIPHLTRFIEKYARKEPKEEIEDLVEQKEQ